MSHVPHELSEELPGKSEAIHALRQSNAHFMKLTETYHEVNRAIHRMETGVEPVDDTILEQEKKKRLKLLDDITQMLVKN